MVVKIKNKNPLISFPIHWPLGDSLNNRFWMCEHNRAHSPDGIFTQDLKSGLQLERGRRRLWISLLIQNILLDMASPGPLIFLHIRDFQTWLDIEVS